jgi:outer membrane usher protein
MALGVATVAARAEQRGRSNDASTEVRFSGAVTWADQQVWLSPPVPQSFAIVDAAGVAGVRVMHNNQLIGRTNADGKLLLPNLAAFATNQVRIDDRDIPMEIELGSVQQEVAPRLNAGAKVKFAGKRVSAVAGVLQLASAAPAETAILAAAQITAANGATNVTSSTDGEGGFYLENLPPGRWALSVVNRKARCNAIITIPEGSPTFVDLGRITCTHE